MVSMFFWLMMMMTNKQGGDKRSTQLWDLDSTLPCSRLSGNPRHQIIIVMTKTKTTKTKTNPRHQIIIVNIIATNMSSQIANVLLVQGVDIKKGCRKFLLQWKRKEYFSVYFSSF